MTDPIYSFRATLFSRERTYRLSPTGIAWTSGSGDGSLAFADMKHVRIYDSPGAAGMPAFTRCVIAPKRGRKIWLSTNHFAGVGSYEVRREPFRAFVGAFLPRAAGANPDIAFIAGMPSALWIMWLVILAGIALVTPLGLVLLVSGGFDGGAPAGIVMALAICLGMLLSFATIVPMVRRNRPKRFDPFANAPV